MLESLNYSFRNPKKHNLSNLPHQTVEKLQKNHGVLRGPQLDEQRWRARLGILRVKLDEEHDGRPMSNVCNWVLIDGDDDNDNNDKLFAEPQYRIMACVEHRQCRLFFSYRNDLPLVHPSTQLTMHNSFLVPRLSNVHKLPHRTDLVLPCVCLQAP